MVVPDHILRSLITSCHVLTETRRLQVHADNIRRIWEDRSDDIDREVLGAFRKGARSRDLDVTAAEAGSLADGRAEGRTALQLLEEDYAAGGLEFDRLQGLYAQRQVRQQLPSLTLCLDR
jgi:hypothetical protein